MEIAPSLDDLISRAVDLDPEALDLLVDHYSSRLYGFMYRMTGRRDSAEDLVQEVFLKMVRSIRTYAHDDRFEAWLFRIAGNVARDRARRVSREQARTGDPITSEMPQSEAPNGESDRGEDRTTVRRRLQAAINRLPDSEREVVLLRHYAELSFAQIAEMMGTPIGTALARAHRGLAKLRSWMESDE